MDFEPGAKFGCIHCIYKSSIHDSVMIGFDLCQIWEYFGDNGHVAEDDVCYEERADGNADDDHFSMVMMRVMMT